MFYRRREDLKIQEIAGEMLLLDQERGEVHHLNQTASFVWHRCDGCTSVAEIVEQVVRTFDVAEETANADVAQTLQQLFAIRVIDQETN